MKAKRYRIRGLAAGVRGVWWDGEAWTSQARHAKTWASRSGAMSAFRSLTKRGETLPGDRIEVTP